jgi:hypothetical protein
MAAKKRVVRVDRGAKAREEARKEEDKVMAKAKKSAPAAPKARKAREEAGEKQQAEPAPVLGPQKKYLKSRPACQVTFTLPAPDAEKVCVNGDFNNWIPDTHLMKKQKNGTFTVTIELEKGRSYRYRYFIDDLRYENDFCADWYEPNPYGGEDSVVNV